MECVSGERVHRCRACHETVIQNWELVCERCAERNRQFEEEMLLAEREWKQEVDSDKPEATHGGSSRSSAQNGKVKKCLGDLREPD